MAGALLLCHLVPLLITNAGLSFGGDRLVPCSLENIGSTLVFEVEPTAPKAETLAGLSDEVVESIDTPV